MADLLTGEETVRVYPLGNEADDAGFVVLVGCDGCVCNLLVVVVVVVVVIVVRARVALELRGVARGQGRGRSQPPYTSHTAPLLILSPELDSVSHSLSPRK